MKHSPPLDILYGHRPPLAKGNLYMAHRCGFTETVLIGSLRPSGFVAVARRRRIHPENGTVVWPGNIDIAPETLYDRSVLLG